MTLGEKIRTLRKQAHLSQEQLAQRLSVSRQAITKWETDSGTPDIDNLKALSQVFSISIDELLLDKKKKNKDYLYESTTEYDIDESKHFDIHLGGAKYVLLSGYEGEKIKIHLASNTYSFIQTDYKIKIDDTKNRLDIDLKRLNNVTEAISKKELSIFINLPSHYMNHVECNVHSELVEVKSLHCDDIELDIRAPYIVLEDVSGHIEIDGHLDMTIECNQLEGKLDINSVNSTSILSIPQETVFKTISRGIGTNIQYENVTPQEEANNIIELNGIKSELIIKNRL